MGDDGGRPLFLHVKIFACGVPLASKVCANPEVKAVKDKTSKTRKLLQKNIRIISSHNIYQTMAQFLHSLFSVSNQDKIS